MGALAQKVFMYKGWESTVISTNSDDVRGQAGMIVSICYWMTSHVEMLLLEVDPARHVDGKMLGRGGRILDSIASWPLSI